MRGSTRRSPGNTAMRKRGWSPGARGPILRRGRLAADRVRPRSPPCTRRIGRHRLPGALGSARFPPWGSRIGGHRGPPRFCWPGRQPDDPRRGWSSAVFGRLSWWSPHLARPGRRRRSGELLATAPAAPWRARAWSPRADVRGRGRNCTRWASPCSAPRCRAQGTVQGHGWARVNIPVSIGGQAGASPAMRSSPTTTGSVGDTGGQRSRVPWPRPKARPPDTEARCPGPRSATGELGPGPDYGLRAVLAQLGVRVRGTTRSYQEAPR